MLLSAYVRDKETKKTQVIERTDYTSKKAFEQVIRGNGYAVIRVSNKRDLAAQDCGFESLAALKHAAKVMKRLQVDVARIEAMPL